MVFHVLAPRGVTINCCFSKEPGQQVRPPDVHPYPLLTACTAVVQWGGTRGNGAHAMYRAMEGPTVVVVRGPKSEKTREILRKVAESIECKRAFTGFNHSRIHAPAGLITKFHEFYDIFMIFRRFLDPFLTTFLSFFSIISILNCSGPKVSFH